MNLLITLPYGPSISDETTTLSSSSFAKSNKLSKLSVVNINNEISDALLFAKSTVANPKEDMEKESNDRIDALIFQADPETKIVYKDLVFEFKLNSISLTIFRNDRKESSALTLFKLIDFVLHGEILTDTTMWVNCSVLDLRVDDIRPSRRLTGIRCMLES